MGTNQIDSVGRQYNPALAAEIQQLHTAAKARLTDLRPDSQLWWPLLRGLESYALAVATQLSFAGPSEDRWGQVRLLMDTVNRISAARDALEPYQGEMNFAALDRLVVNSLACIDRGMNLLQPKDNAHDAKEDDDPFWF